MEYFFIIIILIIVCVYVCYPFFTKGTDGPIYIEEYGLEPYNLSNTKETLEMQKLDIYSAIKEIDFDYGLGKLSDEDHKNLRQNYIYQAAEIVKKIDELKHLEHNKQVDYIENEIAKARGKSESPFDDIEEEIKQERGKKN